MIFPPISTQTHTLTSLWGDLHWDKDWIRAVRERVLRKTITSIDVRDPEVYLYL